MSVPELERAVTEDDSSARSPRTPAASRPRPPSLRPLVLRLHFYAGILVAPFLIIATVSGGLYAMAPTIEQIVYHDQLHVDTEGPALPVSDQIRAAQQVRPDLTVNAVRPAAEPGNTTRVLFTNPSLGESERLAVFVDPVTAEPRGELVMYGSAGALPVRTWISQLHRHLHLGEPGRVYSELAASWLWVIALGGVYLWVQRHRAAKRGGNRRARLLTVDRSTSGRARTLSWHGVAGIWIAVGLIFLSATGLTWSKYAGENVTDLRSSLGWTTPALNAGSSDHDGHGGHHTTPPDSTLSTADSVDRLDSVLTVARSQGVDGEIEASIPSEGDTAFTVAQTRQSWRFSTDSVAVDANTGTVTDTVRFDDWPLAAKLSTWGIALHMGILFGLTNQLALLALAVVLMTIIVRGYVLWWRRRPTRGDRIVGRAPARGTWRRVRPTTLVVTVLIAAGVGWFAPLLGLSLVAFLAVDVAVSTISRRRTVPVPHST